MTAAETSVLVLTPVGRDARIAVSILAASKIDAHICSSLEDTLPLLEQAQCLVVAEEALINVDRGRLAAWLERQPAWSDFPIVLLVMRGTDFDKRLAFLDRYLIVLERPFLASSLTNSVRSALRARARQLEVKSYIEQKQEVADRQKLLIRELHHRVKNTLANVRAMMGATARSSGSIEDFMKDFSARIVSLADTHSMLTDDYWQTASLHKLLERELRHYETRDTPRIVIEGPDVALIADIAIPVGMAFHELASNSSKFGALSRPLGRLDVRWSVGRAGDARIVNLDWKELDGPRVEPPTRRGFGTTLLEKVVAVQCDASIRLNYLRDGLHFTMALPLRETRLVPAYS
ncbi:MULTISPECIES: sensor histidine kinase [unclassified Mesorhizobium]|uniref:sensor histidine kinase n=1 Tax=unclassified Mesorhizobium TaxID=325217 RepID=UPI001CC9EBBC|nr:MULTISPECIES: sensor histidine kinase [unclassified Mesorhizobium]MBZ9742038.1 sensor histidine kinase [Mesorhizobium sp. CO1-1-4]MBZ9806013.1 sensor histidine kinase [Mesorhizobium sp. ES1-6]MBZ9995900.1 sensor histidine kinase [Mesorhizobium sp. BH1-1-4]